MLMLLLRRANAIALDNPLGGARYRRIVPPAARPEASLAASENAQETVRRSRPHSARGSFQRLTDRATSLQQQLQHLLMSRR